MYKLLVSLFLTMLILSFFITSKLFAQMDNNYLNTDENFINTVKVIEPQPSETVGNRLIVRGTAEIQDNSEVWVFVHREDFLHSWWPQGKPTMDALGNRHVNVYLGLEIDVGMKFEIAVGTFDKQISTMLREYHLHAMKTGSWRPIELPKATSEIIPFKVTKIKH